MKYSYGVISAGVHCDDCGWETYSYKNAQAIAKIHAQKNHHLVSGELGIYFTYNGREKVADGSPAPGKEEECEHEKK
jgi:hypothetical protein